MRSSIIAGALFASLAAASPVKRAEVVEVDVVTNVVVVTSTKGAPGPSPAPVAPAQKFAVVTVPAPVKSSAAPKAPAPKAPAPKAPAPAVPQPKPANSPATGSAPDTSDFKATVLFHHNQHRANHSAEPCEWDAALAAAAEKIASTCVFKHQMNVDGLSYGQNIANGNPASQVGKTISDQFYNGEFGKFSPGDYGSANPTQSPFEETGHLTQIIWKGTKKIGCAVANCPGQAGNSYTVCNYGPAGKFPLATPS